MWGAIVSWVAVIAGIYGVFARSEKHLRPDARILLSRWLRGTAGPDAPWSTLFATLFDRLFLVREITFGNRIRIWRPSFFRSIVASLLSVAFVTLIWHNLLPPDVQIAMRSAVPPNVLIDFDLILLYQDGRIRRFPIDFLIATPVVVNLLTDYLSLIETRFILNKVQKSTTRTTTFLWILTDGTLTLLIAFVAVVAFFSIFGPLLTNLKPSFVEGLNIGLFEFRRGLRFWDSSFPGAGIAGWTIYSTFLTSAWLWLFLFSRVLVRALIVVPLVVAFVNRMFDLDELIDQYPLQVMGYVLMVFLSVVGWSLKAVFS